MKIVRVGEGKFRIELHVVTTKGHGISATLLSSNAPHIGGVVMAIPYQKPNGQGLSCDISQISVPKHKDIYAAVEVAKICALGTGETTCVSAGLHVDNANEEDIQQLIDNAKLAAEIWLARYA